MARVASLRVALCGQAGGGSKRSGALPGTSLWGRRGKRVQNGPSRRPLVERISLMQTIRGDPGGLVGFPGVSEFLEQLVGGLFDPMDVFFVDGLIRNVLE